MRVKPTEVRLVSGLLMEEHPDADALAETIIRALDTKREEEDPGYVVVAQYKWEEDGLTTCAYGPYKTAKQADKAMESLVNPGVQAQAMRLALARHP